MTKPKWKVFALHALLAIAGISGGASANAETIFEDNFMVSMSSVPKVQALGQSAAGRWTVTVNDLAWPQVLQSLSFSITDYSHVLASQSTAGTLIYDVLVPTALFATVYAHPDAAVGVGVYHIKASFSPAAPPVPLPAAVWLMLSGICGIAALRRKHATVTNSVVQ